ncbi:AAA family ATPase [Micromonospora sp. NPDC023737]|uniref:AAA family ATPase n=1 Tax=unclassified Micromonospora TaxID=2617518 RepID=UPI0033C27E2C
MTITDAQIADEVIGSGFVDALAELEGREPDDAPPPEEEWGQRLPDEPPEEPLFIDVAQILANGLPKPPAPVLLRREDGHALFYAAKVNVLFGDPECGKTWIALAAAVEALQGGRRVAVIDLDHNGAAEILSRLLMLGATPAMLGDPNRFRLAEPEDTEGLILVVAALRAWRPAVAIVDSLGELMPLLGLSSNSPDDYTSGNRRVLTPLSNAGAAVIAIDHLPKSEDARSHGQTGTLAKRRTINGISLRVTVAEPFAPGRGGAASMTIHKDRPGGVRAHCPANGKSQPAGRFVMTAHPDGTTTWKVTKPTVASAPGLVPDADVAELDGLVPPPTSKRDVQDRLKWGSDRAQKALARWRDLRKDDE